MSDGRDEQIRNRAYKIWQDEGEPHGRDEEHWNRAASEIGEVISVTGEPEDADASASGPAASDASGADLAPPVAAAVPAGTATKATPGTSA